MSAAQIIEEIKHLTPAEQMEVIQFTFQLARKRQLTGEELGKLTDRMVKAQDPSEINRLREEIVSGFYGDEPHA